MKTPQNELFLVMKERIEALSSLLHVPLSIVLSNLSGLSLQGSVYSHPLLRTAHTVIAGHHVTSDTGTGIVHTAPAHGLDDFNICVYHNVIQIPGDEIKASEGDIPRVSLPGNVPRYLLQEDVDENGKFKANVWDERINGRSVLDEGSERVVCFRERSQCRWNGSPNRIIWCIEVKSFIAIPTIGGRKNRLFSALPRNGSSERSISCRTNLFSNR